MNEWKYALRSLSARPGFFAICVLTVALGVGATAAIFSAVNGVLLRPLPYPDDGKLMVLWYANEREGIDRDVTSLPTFEDWRSASAIASAGASTSSIGTFTGERDAEQFAGAWVIGDFFETLGVRPAAGVALDGTHMRAGADQVIVLSQRARDAWFGAGAEVVGRQLVVNGVSREIVGVMPRGFSYPTGADYWLPIPPDDEDWSQLAQSRGSYWLSVVARLAPGATVETASVELDAIAARLIADGANQPGDGVFVEPLRDTIVGSVRPAVTALAGAVAFVLLIAAANLANLLLARGASRQREFAVRAALGASGGTLARQAMTESVVIGVIGGAVGLALAYAAVAALGVAAPAELPRVDDVRIDWVVVGFGLAVSVVTALAFGLAPALQARGTALAGTLRDGERGPSEGAGRLRPALVVAEIALALVLSIGAGLLIKSFAALQAVEPGFRTHEVLSFRTTLPGARYAGEAEVRAFVHTLEERLRALPGVTGVAATNTLFLARLPNMGPVSIEGRPPAGPDDPVISVTNDFVSTDFFRELELPLVGGRGFTTADGPDEPPVVVVNEAFVRRILGGGDAIGQRFTRGNPTSPDAVWQTIVGVVADSRRSGLAAPVRPEAYRPLTQVAPRSLEWLVTTAVPPLSVAPQVRGLVRELDPNLAVAQLTTVDAALADSVATRRFVMSLLTVFAGLALALASIGLYGVLAYLVAQRRREIGLRMALGARGATVVALVLRQSFRWVVPGVLLGVLGSLLLMQALRSQLYGVSATDPVTFAALVVLLGLVAFVASWWPARRAAAIAPMEALRHE